MLSIGKTGIALEPFEGLRAAILVAMTAAIGFLLSAAFAVVWNTWAKVRS